jgi:uroporphyrinogen III methyltransferase/synthase
MGLSRLDRIVGALIAEGKDPDTPAAVVRWATTGEQQTLTAPLRHLPERVRLEGMTPPAIVLIGPVVALRDELAWFERRPLLGKRILVTRPRHQAAELVDRLLALGAVPFLLPTVEVREPDSWGPVDDAIAELANYHWLVFTSVNGVRAFMERLRLTGRDLRALGHLRLAAIGPRTADALRAYHLDPDVVPERYQSEDLAAALKSAIAPGERVLMARADRGRDVLRDVLAGHCDVAQIAVYSQVDAADAKPEILDHLRRGEIDYITLTSSNIARALIGQLDATTRARIERGDTRLVSLSPVTSAEIRRLGLPVAHEAGEATMQGLVQALREAAQAC